jgi:preprotein translocase SecF subunit
LARDGLLAILLSFMAIMIYIWLRFEWQFAIGTVATLVHDVALTVGLLCILRVQFDLTSIAAILTIVGYSLNDTVVVFDRFRENLRKYKKMPFDQMVDMSLNQTLPRTLMTSISTLVALGALYVFGGEVLRGFTFIMIFGVLVGTYSSIFIGAPLLSYMGAYVDRAPPAVVCRSLRLKQTARPTDAG